MRIREVYREMMEAQIEEWKAKLGKLKSEAEHKKGEAKIGYNKNIEALNNKIEVVQEKLKELKLNEADNEAWHVQKESFERAVCNLRSLLYNARSNFK